LQEQCLSCKDSFLADSSFTGCPLTFLSPSCWFTPPALVLKPVLFFSKARPGFSLPRFPHPPRTPGAAAFGLLLSIPLLLPVFLHPPHPPALSFLIKRSFYWPSSSSVTPPQRVGFFPPTFLSHSPSVCMTCPSIYFRHFLRVAFE